VPRLPRDGHLIWGARGQAPEQAGEFLDVWRQYATNIVAHAAIECGHYIHEEVPEKVIIHFTSFFGQSSRRAALDAAAKCRNTMTPNGRTAKPVPNVASLAREAAVPLISWSGSKCRVTR
jgi:hypothetical protein